MHNFIPLWRYNQTTEFWERVRECAVEQAQQWLHVFQHDEPGEHFKLALHRPRAKPRTKS